MNELLEYFITVKNITTATKACVTDYFSNIKTYLLLRCSTTSVSNAHGSCLYDIALVYKQLICDLLKCRETAGTIENIKATNFMANLPIM